MTGHVVAVGTEGSHPSVVERVESSRFLAVGLAIAVIWLAVLVASVYAPTLIVGANHEQLAVAAMGDWVWGGLATAFLLLAAAFSRPEGTAIWWMVALVTVAIWIVAGLASVFAPSLVTGTDPSTIPLVAMFAPIAAVVATAFLSVFAAGAASRPTD